MMEELYAVEERLGYEFSDRSLLLTALTHPSLGPKNYQRLEFLGDAVLQMAVSAYLFEHRPDVSEGQLSRHRAAIVCEESLSEISRTYGLPEHVRMSVGEVRTGGRDKPSIQADVLEAVLAAVCLDGGYDLAFELVYKMLGRKLDSPQRQVEDAKTALQELLQKDGGHAPVYQLIRSSGPPHAPVFEMSAVLDDREIGRGTGRSKQLAQQSAALEALRRLQGEKK